MTRTILHLDLDAFFCAVEELHNPALKGKPFAVGGNPDERGVVASCSYPARKLGVRSAMPMRTALRLCRDLIIVRHSHGRYGEVSKQVMAILHELTPLVEQLSIDEAFMDVTGLPGNGESIARNLQKRIYDELRLPASLGVATSKLIAKIADNIGKSSVQTDSYPNAITVIPPGEEAAFLAPLPVRELWGVGPRTAEKMARFDLHTIGDIAAYPRRDLIYHFGKHGADLSDRARGIDERPIETTHETKSISREITYAEDVRDGETLKRTLREMSESVGRTLRRKHLSGKTVTIKLRWTDFTTLTRQTTFPYAIDQDEMIFEAALQLLYAHRPNNQKVRLIGVGVSGLESNPVRQLGLWETPAPPENENLQSALDALRDRFGDDIVQRGIDFEDE